MAEPVSVGKVKRSLGIITSRGVGCAEDIIQNVREKEKTKNMKCSPGMTSKVLAGFCLHCVAFGALKYMQGSRCLAGRTHKSRAALIAMMHLTF